MVFIEMQQYKGPGNKKFCNIHSRSSLDIRLAFLPSFGLFSLALARLIF